MTTRRDDHSELVEVLTELLGLLDDLVAIEPNTLLYPQPDTGLHVPGTINATAASVAGYSTQAITLMSSLPYLQHSEFQIGPSTHMVTYANQDEGGFEEERIMYVESGEELMSSSAVQLTSGESIYGLWRIYDTDKKVVYVWDKNDHDIYFEAPPLSPREAFQALLDSFRSLNWLVTETSGWLHTDWPWTEFPRDWPESHRREYETDHDVWKAVRGLAHIYVDCGWDVNAVDQPAFRREEFIRRRKQYVETIVVPLEEIHQRAGEDRRAGDAAQNELRTSLHGQSVNPAYRIF
ncbi:hypothetical protein MBLNU13_g03458t2 [Cladosporium sp. NU13]